MKKIYSHLKTYILIYLGVFIYIFFYIAVKMSWSGLFFNSNALHLPSPQWGDIFRGIDFFQVPRGAWSFWHGGDLTGVPQKNGGTYAPGQVVNSNVYHPLFTLAIGSFLIQFPANQVFDIWLWIKLAITLITVAYFFWSFRDSKYVSFAIFILLVNFSAFLELGAGQFHFVLNELMLLFLIGLSKRQSFALNGTYYWLTLLVKPVGLLFAPILLIKRQWKVAILGVIIFALLTWAFQDKGNYYVNNLMQNTLHPTLADDPQIITLNVLLRDKTHWPDIVYSLIQYSVLAFIIFFSAFRRIHISKAIFLHVVYFLLFYNLVYEYDWSTLAYVNAVCIIYNQSFQTRFSQFCLLLVSLPSGFAILRLLHFDIKEKGGMMFGAEPGTTAWQLEIVSKLIPVLLLCISVVMSDIKPNVKQFREFFGALRKIHDQLKTFG
jgi:hypothetical protein